MPDERTCRTCWHWGVIEPCQGLCGHPDTGGAVYGADDTCCNHLAIVGRGRDGRAEGLRDGRHNKPEAEKSEIERGK